MFSIHRPDFYPPLPQESWALFKHKNNIYIFEKLIISTIILWKSGLNIIRKIMYIATQGIIVVKKVC